MTPLVAIINASTAVTDDEAHAGVNALRKQVNGEFANAWGLHARVGFVPTGHKPPPGSWQLYLLDNSDQAGALGYHDLTPEGLPAGKVFAATDKQYGLSWTVTASHELLEMLADPLINLGAFTQDAQGNVQIYAWEDCDACEADELGYQIDGIHVSDFVHPEFFNPSAPAGTKLDHMGHITHPFEIAPGGYLSVWSPGGGWTQLHGDKPKPGDRARVGSRRERRTVPREQWLCSAKKVVAPRGATETSIEN